MAQWLERSAWPRRVVGAIHIFSELISFLHKKFFIKFPLDSRIFDIPALCEFGMQIVNSYA